VVGLRAHEHTHPRHRRVGLVPRRLRHAHDELPEHIHWEGPPIALALASLAVVFVIVAALTIVAQHNCVVFHVCSDIVRDHPHPYLP
jgi:hypothetical protein